MPDLRIGDRAINALYVGDRPVLRVYKGATLVWEASAGASDLAGTIAAQSGASGVLSRQRGIAGQVDGLSVLTGSVSRVRRLAGTLAASSSLTGAIGQPTVPLAGTIAAQSGVSGAMTRARGLAAVSADSSALSGSVGRARGLSGAMAASSGGSGALAGNPPSFINLGASNIASGTTSMELALPSGITAGNILVAVTSVVSTRNPTWSAGWTAIGAGFSAYRVADGTETVGPTVSWTGASGQSGWIAQFTAGTVGATRDNQAQSGSPATVAAITTTAANSRCEAFILSGSATLPSVPSGYASDATDTSSFVVSSIRIAGVDKSASGESSGAVSSTVNSASTWRAVLIEMKAP